MKHTSQELSTIFRHVVVSPCVDWVISIEAVQMHFSWSVDPVQNSLPTWSHPLANQGVVNTPSSTRHMHQGCNLQIIESSIQNL